MEAVSSVLYSATGTSGNGINVQEAVNAAMYMLRAPERLMQQDQATLNTQAAALRDLSAKLATFESGVNALNDITGAFSFLAVSSSDSTILNATADTTAAIGSHAVKVSILATTASYYSTPFESSSTLLPTGTFDLKVGSNDAVTITVGDTSATLDELVAHINNDFEATATGTLTLTGNAAADETVVVGSTTYTFKTAVSSANDVLRGATAADSLANLQAAINHETGEGTTYGTGTVANTDATATAVTDTLTIEARTAGASGNSLDTTATLASGSFGAATLERGRDDLGVTASVITDANGARLTLVSKTSGAPGDLTISNDTTGAEGNAMGFVKPVSGTNASLTVDGVPIISTSNTVTGVIAGVTLSLSSAAPGQTVTIGIDADLTQAAAGINTFLSSYNTLMQAINSQFQYSTSSGSAGPLAGNSGLRALQEQLLTDMTYSLSGNNGFVNLATLGIPIQNDGTLTVNSAELSEALSHNLADVKNFFQSTSPAGLAQNLSAHLTILTDATTGLLSSELNRITQNTSYLTNQIQDFADRIQSNQQQLTLQYNQINTTLQQLPSLLAEINSQIDGLNLYGNYR